MKVRGTETPNHRAKIATRVPKGIAAEEPSTQRMRFIRKKSANTILKKDMQTKETKRKRTCERDNRSVQRKKVGMYRATTPKYE